MANLDIEGRVDPLVLIIPGLHNSGPEHWQTKWEQERDDCVRVDLGMWDKPHRNTWVNKLNLAIRQYADRPVILVAHSLGCLAVAWWAQYERPAYGTPVAGALLVAPPEVDHAPLAQALVPFAPAPNILLPFPSIVVASRDDPYMKFERARRLATFWGSGFIDAGAAGHINADSSLGKWSYGRSLLDRLVNHVRGSQSHQPLFDTHPASEAAEEPLWNSF